MMRLRIGLFEKHIGHRFIFRALIHYLRQEFEGFVSFPISDITNSECDQLPVGLIAQLVEHCSGIAEVIGSNLVQAWISLTGFNFKTS